MFKPSRTPRLLRTVILVPVLLAVAVAAYAEDQVSRREAYYKNIEIMAEVYERILENYVDEEDPHAIMYAAIKGMLS